MSQLLEYKCPNCGGAIQFDSAAQKMKCPYCGTELDVESLKSYDEELKNAKPDNLNWSAPSGSTWQEGEEEGVSVFSCQSCGGEIVGDENTAASSCPFCGNPVIMTGRLSGSLRPDCVIPFKLDKEAAKAALNGHFKGKLLLPRIFKEQNHIDEIRGIYVPFWLFDANADADMRFRATKTSFWSDSRYNYTRTSYFLVSRSGSLGFERVPVDGSTKMPDDLMESIEPYRYADAVDFQTAYLSGYLADKYDVDAEHSVDRANERVRKSTEQAIAATVRGYDMVRPESGSVRLTESAVRYALLPVWVLNTTWNGGRYLFAMNGQTGKFVGNLPTDWKKFWLWLIGLTPVIGAVILGLLWFLRFP